MKSELDQKIQSSQKTVVDKISSNEKSITSLSSELSDKIDFVSILVNNKAKNNSNWLFGSVFMQIVFLALLVVVLSKV